MAAAWTWLIRRKTPRLLVGPTAPAVPVPSPKIRFVGLLVSGTHVLWAAQMSKFATTELTLAKGVVGSLRKGMLCLADRLFPGYQLWQMAAKTGADLLWRTKRTARLDMEKRLAD